MNGVDLIIEGFTQIVPFLKNLNLIKNSQNSFVGAFALIAYQGFEDYISRASLTF
jgi:hypothetical protein